MNGNLRSTVRNALIYGIAAAFITLAAAFGLSAAIGEQVEEQTAKDVHRLVTEAQKNREVVCVIALSVVKHPPYTQEEEDRVVEICAPVVTTGM